MLAGPRGLPLLGYGPLIPKDVPVHKVMQNLAKTYGSVTGLFLGPTQAVVSVVGPQACKEALLNDDLNGRPTGALILKKLEHLERGLVN